MPDGREVLEVDPDGRPLVVRRSPAAPPQLTASAEAAVQRVVAFAARIGYRFDRAARRRFRERMLGGETEAQLLAPYRRQAEALEELEAYDGAAGAQAEPPGDPELDQALRLAAPRPPGPHPPEAQP